MTNNSDRPIRPAENAPFTEFENKFIGEIFGDGVTLPKTVDELRAIVSTNMARERERCAKIIEREIGWVTIDTPALRRLVAAIRSGK